jgi:hypothetical protein
LGNLVVLTILSLSVQEDCMGHTVRTCLEKKKKKRENQLGSVPPPSDLFLIVWRIHRGQYLEFFFAGRC